MARAVRIGLPILALALLAVGEYLGLAWAPPDREMGHAQRIMYVHVPAAWVALLAFAMTGLCSVAYLWKSRFGWDAVAEASAEVGVFFNALALVLGSIWARPTWGVWWDWDPRLTTFAINLVAFVGYLALRKFVVDPHKRATWSAVVGIVSCVNLVIVWKSVQWWKTLHQVQSTPQTVDPAMTLALRVNAFAFLAVLVWFIWLRYHIARARLAEELAPPSALPAPAPKGATAT